MTLVRRLEDQHVAGRQLAAAYASAVNAYAPGDDVSGTHLAAAARA